jgi:hypothetical protein
MNNNDSNNSNLLLTTPSFIAARLLYNALKMSPISEHLEYLEELADRAVAENEVNRDIEEWKKQPPHPRRTRVIIKLINNTSIPFKVTQAGWNMSDSDRESLDLDPHTSNAFKWEFVFTKPGPASPSDKIQFKQFISFGNGSTHFRFDTGLALKSSFGVFSPTLTPQWAHRVVSTGATKVKCSSTITEQQTEAPHSYEVAITLG